MLPLRLRVLSLVLRRRSAATDTKLPSLLLAVPWLSGSLTSSMGDSVREEIRDLELS